jgi:hypothetical protein
MIDRIPGKKHRKAWRGHCAKKMEPPKTDPFVPDDAEMVRREEIERDEPGTFTSEEIAGEAFAESHWDEW